MLSRKESFGAVEADPVSLVEMSEMVAAWLDPEDPEKVKQALEGLGVTVWAGAGQPRATGTLPVHATCGRNSHPDVCTVVSTNRGFPFRLPFEIPHLR